MQNVAIGTVIQKSFERTIFILFKPFSIKKWLLLLLIASLAGSLGGGSGNFGGSGSSSREKEAEAQEEEVLGTQQMEQMNEEYRTKEYLTPEESKQRTMRKQRNRSSLRESYRRKVDSYGRVFVFVVVVVGVLFVLAFIIFFTWLGARFKFVWLHVILNNDASIKEPFARYEKEGNSLFKLLLILFAATIAWIAILGAWVWVSGSSVGLFEKGADVAFLTVMKIFALPVFIFIIGFIALVIVGVIIEHFMVPIMGLDMCLFVDAWHKCIQIARQNRTDFFLFFLVLIGLAILSGIIAVIIALICILVILLAGALLFGLPYLLIVIGFKVPVLFYIYAVLVGVPFITAVILLFMSINLPIAVFFRNFSLYYLSALECEYTPLPLTPVAPIQQN